LIKDFSNQDLNKGYAFFEYMDEKAADKAIKALNGLEIKDKRLKVQWAAQGQKQAQLITAHKNVPAEKSLSVTE
jgi:RNA recognition motif-containing protein